MRNLAGRLHARSAEELSRIAGFWQIPVSGRDRHAVVGQLYREMRDIRTARDLWERLTTEEQEIVRALALSDRASDLSVTIVELAGAIGRDVDETRAIAIELYRKGIVAREGDDDELPIGEIPRIFLPRELAAVFGRVQDEIDAGDVSATPLQALLALLDDAEIDDAAELWGVAVVPGLQTRTALIGQVLTAIGNEHQRLQVTRRLSSDPKRLSVWLMEESPGSPARLADVLETLGLEGDSPAASQRRRNALAELERSLLAWHTYQQDGSRWLFVPREIVNPSQRGGNVVVAPASIDDRQVTGSPWLHPFAVPWDILTLVRALQLPGTPQIRTFDDAPSGWLSQLNSRLWNADPGSDEPPAGYLAFLAALARNEGVIEGGGPGSREGMRLGNAWKHWRSRSFVDQLGHCLWWWNSSAGWIEGREREAVFVNRAEWPQFRRKLLVLLAMLDSRAWYRVGDLANWVASLDPDILGPEAEVATSRAMQPARGAIDRPAAAAADVVAETLRSAFAWFGLVEMGSLDDKVEVVRTTDALRQLEAAELPADVAPLPGEPLVISDTLSIELRAPAPVRVWAITAFADPVELRPVPIYRMTANSLERALAAGASVRDVTRFLESQTGAELSTAVQETLLSWAGAYRRVWLSPALLIEPDDARSRDRIARLVNEAGWEVDNEEGVVQVRLSDPASLPEVLERIAAILRNEGYTATEKRPPPSPELADGSDGG